MPIESLKINFNIILLSTSMSLNWFLTFGFSNETYLILCLIALMLPEEEHVLCSSS